MMIGFGFTPAIAALSGGDGGGALTPAQAANAHKIVAGRQGYSARTVMSSPPTLTSAATSAIGSTNNGASANSISLLDATKIRICGPAKVKNSGAPWLGTQGDYSQYGAGGRFWGGAGWSCEFVVIGAQFEITDNLWSQWRLRMLVNGEWASAAHWSKADFGNPADGNRVLRFNFGSSATRHIRLYGSFSDGPAWVNLASGGSIALPAIRADDPSMRWWGDSFVEASYAFNTGYDVTGTTPIAVGEQLGVALPVPSGRSAQGHTVPVDGLTMTQRIVDNAPRLSARVHEIVMGSVNDNASAPADVTAAVLASLQAVRANNPNCCITFVCPFTFDSNPTSPTIYAANKAGALAAAATDPGILIIETSDLPSVNNGGTLPNGQTQVSMDGVHPGKAWSAYVAPIIADRIATGWQAKL